MSAASTVALPYGPAPFPTPNPNAQPRPPSWITRIALGILILVGIYLGAVTLPGFLLHTLNTAGVPVPTEAVAFVYVGLLLAITGALAYILRPTRAYGPAAIACDMAEIAYSILIYLESPIRISFSMGGGGGSGGSNSVAFAIGFTLVMVIFILAELIHLAGDAVTTAEDIRHPHERLWWTYPIR